MLLNRVKRCTADNIRKRFSRESFDIIVSHYGMHYQEKAGFEDALYVLKKGCELLVSGTGNRMPKLRQEHMRYSLIDHKPSFRPWAYHISKK